MNERPLHGGDVDAADAAIDRAVREIMSAEPRAGFRQRVLARLDDEPQRGSGWPRLGFAAIAAATILALAIWIGSGDRIVQQQPAAKPAVEANGATESPAHTPSTVTPAPSPSASTPPTTTPPRVDGRIVERQRTPVRSLKPAPDRPVAAASVTAAEESAEREAARNRNTIDPIAIPPIRIAPIEVGEIIVRPVTVGPLVVVPLPPPR